MLIHPWVFALSEQLYTQYSSNQMHHSLLLIGQSQKTSLQLVEYLVQTLFCDHPTSHNEPCHHCSECLLFEAHTHPDFYLLTSQDKAKKVGVEQIRELSQIVLQLPQRSRARFVIIPDVSQLTESAANALLKLIEEPPTQSYFILMNQTLNTVMATLRSRCLVIHLPIPNTATALKWLKEHLNTNNSTTLPEIEAALKLNSGDPECALAWLTSAIWDTRKEFTLLLDKVLTKKTFLALLNYCNQQDGRLIAYWLASLFLDINKLQQGLQCHVLNSDQIEITKQFAVLNVNAIQLNALIKHCFSVREKLINIQGINQELLFVELFIQMDAILFNQGN